MNFKLFSLLFFLLNFYQISAQKYALITQKNGKKFYNHTVVDGNSIYGLQQMYNCPVEDILEANPGIERGLNDGQLVLVPAQEKIILHTVQNQETLYKISKMYAVPVDSIITKNPGCETSLKAGQRLKIENAVPRIQVDLLSVSIEENTREVPKPSEELKSKFIVSFKDSIINHVVLPTETIYTISKRFMIPVETLRSVNNLNSNKVETGQDIKIPLKKEKIEAVKIRDVPIKNRATKDSLLVFERKEKYNVALFLPFNLDSTATFNKPVVNAALDYYMGASLALDSLRKMGFSANFYVYDYQAKNESIHEQLEKLEFKSMDLIFAPLQVSEAEIVADWGKQNKVRVVLSVNMPPKLLESNRFVYALNPDNEILIRNLAYHIYKKHDNQQIVLIKGTKPDEDWMNQVFINYFKEFPAKKSRPRVIEADWTNFKNFESMSTQTMFIFLSTDKDKVLKLLDKYKGNETVSIFGLKDWVDWKEVNGTVMNKYEFTYASPTHFDLRDPQVMNFHKLYRRFYNTDLTKTACQGYDAILNVCSAFFLEKEFKKGLINSYQLNQIGNGNGIQNEGGFVLRYRDFESKIDDQ